MDQYDDENNGTTITARRLAKALLKRGFDIKIISSGEKRECKFAVDELKLPPFIDKIVKSQGMQFAKPDEKVLYEAIEWADIVHFVMPFFISIKGLKIAKKLHKPHTAAFHVQPQNITYSIGLGQAVLPNNFFILSYEKFIL